MRKMKPGKFTAVLLSMLLAVSMMAMPQTFASTTSAMANTFYKVTAEDLGLTSEGVSYATLTAGTTATVTFDVAEAGNYALFMQRSGADAVTVTAKVSNSDGSTTYDLSSYLFGGSLNRIGACTSSTTTSAIGNSGVMNLSAGKWTVVLGVSSGTLKMSNIVLKQLDHTIAAEGESVIASFDFVNAGVMYAHLDQQSYTKYQSASGYSTPWGIFQSLYFSYNGYLDYSLNIEEAGYYDFGFSTAGGNDGEMSIYLNGSENPATTFATTSPSTHNLNTAKGVYLKAGANTIRVKTTSAVYFTKIVVSKSELQGVSIGDEGAVEISPAQTVTTGIEEDGYYSFIMDDTAVFETEVTSAGKYVVKIDVDTLGETPAFSVLVDGEGLETNAKFLKASRGLQSIAIVDLTAGTHSIEIVAVDVATEVYVYNFAIAEAAINVGEGKTTMDFSRNIDISEDVEINGSSTSFTNGSYIEFMFAPTVSGNYSFRLYSVFSGSPNANVTSVLDEGTDNAKTYTHNQSGDVGTRERIMGVYYLEAGSVHTFKVTCNTSDAMTFASLSVVNVDQTVSASGETIVAPRDYTASTLSLAHVVNQYWTMLDGYSSVVLSNGASVTYNLVPESAGWYNVSVYATNGSSTTDVVIDIQDYRTSTAVVPKSTSKTKISFDNPIYLNEGSNSLRFAKTAVDGDYGGNTWIFKIVLTPSDTPDITEGGIMNITTNNTVSVKPATSAAGTSKVVGGAEVVTYRFEVSESAEYLIQFYGTLTSNGAIQYLIDSGSYKRPDILAGNDMRHVLGTEVLEAGSHTISIRVDTSAQLTLHNIEITAANKYLPDDESETSLLIDEFKNKAISNLYHLYQVGYPTTFDGTKYSRVSYIGTNASVTYGFNAESAGWYKLSILAASTTEGSSMAVYVNSAEEAAAKINLSLAEGSTKSAKQAADTYIWLDKGVNNVKIQSVSGNARIWKIYIQQFKPSVTFTKDNTPAEEITAGDITVSVDMNTVKENENITYSVVLYEETTAGIRLREVYMSEPTTEQTYSKTVTVSDSGTYKIKVFVWSDTTGMTPIIHVAELTK